MQSVLAAREGSDVRVYVVWLPILATDFSAPNTSVMGRIADTRVRQFWDREQLIAKAIAAAGPDQPAPDCCDMDGILWDLAAVYTRGLRWEDRLPPAAFLNGPVVHLQTEIDQALAQAAAR